MQLVTLDDIRAAAELIRPSRVDTCSSLSGRGRHPRVRCIAIKGLCPDARVFGVEPELAADTAEGLRLGHRVDWTIEDRNRTIADGLRSQPSELTFAHLQQVLDGVITVSENEIRAAVRELAYQAHLVAEPSGAVALAAYRKGATPPGRTVMILSGGNIEPPMLQEILAPEKKVAGHLVTPPIAPWPIALTRMAAKMAHHRLQEFHAAQHISARASWRGAQRPASRDRRVQVVSPG